MTPKLQAITEALKFVATASRALDDAQDSLWTHAQTTCDELTLAANATEAAYQRLKKDKEKCKEKCE